MEFSIHRDLSPNYSTAKMYKRPINPVLRRIRGILNWTHSRSGHIVRISLKKKKEDKVHQINREERLPATTSCCFPSPKCTLSVGILLIALLQCASLKGAHSMTIKLPVLGNFSRHWVFFLCSSSSRVERCFCPDHMEHWEDTCAFNHKPSSNQQALKSWCNQLTGLQLEGQSNCRQTYVRVWQRSQCQRLNWVLQGLDTIASEMVILS